MARTCRADPPPPSRSPGSPIVFDSPFQRPWSAASLLTRTRQYLEYLAVRQVAWFTGFVSLPQLVRVGRWLGRLIYKVWPPRYGLVCENIQRFMGGEGKNSEAERDAVIGDFYQNLAAFCLLAVSLSHQSATRVLEYTRVHISSEFLHDLAQRGVIVASMHLDANLSGIHLLGPWELLLPLFSSLRTLHHVDVIYRPLHNPFLEAYSRKCRQADERFAFVQDSGCLPSLSVGPGRAVSFLSDQRPSRSRLSAKIKGHSLDFSPGLGVLAEREQAPVWGVYLVLDDTSGKSNDISGSNKLFTLNMQKIGDGSEDSAQEVIAKYASFLERALSLYHSQYLWTHSFWRNRNK